MLAMVEMGKMADMQLVVVGMVAMKVIVNVEKMAKMVETAAMEAIVIGEVEEMWIKVSRAVLDVSLSASISWEELAKDDIAKYGKAGILLRGARYREGLSQKELAKRTGIS